MLYPMCPYVPVPIANGESYLMQSSRLIKTGIHQLLTVKAKLTTKHGLKNNNHSHVVLMIYIFDEVGTYLFRSNNHQLFFFDAESFKDHDLDEVIKSFISCNNVTTKSN